MQYKGQAQNIAAQIIEAFESGKVPKALATVFINKGGRNSDSYSWANRMLVALAGYSDVMGYGAKNGSSGWKSVGRQVRKGEKCLVILAPCKKKVKNDAGDERFITFGFHGLAVYGIEQTIIVDDKKWAKHNEGNEQAERFVDSLPLAEVAKAWGYELGTYRGKGSAALGWHDRTGKIALGVENLATWAHELCHAADYMNGNLVEHGQHWRSETVAELGGAVLMMILGNEREADLGGAMEYIRSYATTAKITLIKACSDVLERTCQAVTKILETAETINGSDEHVSLGSDEHVSLGSDEHVALGSDEHVALGSETAETTSDSAMLVSVA